MSGLAVAIVKQIFWASRILSTKLIGKFIKLEIIRTLNIFLISLDSVALSTTKVLN